MFDFRSDTVTMPTPEMMASIAAADIGDAARGDDPTVNRLEAVAAEMTGKEAALFTPSGTMANLSALLAHVWAGDEVIVDETAHIYNSEVGSMAAVAGALPRPVRSRDGIMDPSDVAAAIRPNVAHAAPTRLICLETTHNAAGGVVLPLENMAAIHGVAKGAGLALHLDGARMFNAAVYLNVSVSAICEHADSVMFALSKGLGAPVGSVLAGSRDFIDRARKKSRMFGGGMRQAGLIAAPALVALSEPFARLRRDHAMARKLAEGLKAIDASLVRLDQVHTNIVNCYVDRFADDAGGFVQRLKNKRVLANYARTKVRFVTHSHIDDAAIAACLRGVEKAVDAERCPT